MTCKARKKGFTLVELMMVIAIMAMIASIVLPRYYALVQKAYQSKARGNLGAIRSALSLYYSENEGLWPFKNYAPGPITDGLSLTKMMVPRYMNSFPIPKVVDQMPDYNGLSFNYDLHAIELMTQSPVLDVWIIPGQGPDWTPGVEGPYAYDYETGLVYYANGNYDTTYFHYIYEW